ncbi:hypothetical protein KIPB_006379 [Kipferlia bialata]|uniref:Uncharacterized protein n=1 Tax=Kipferlia bialata TaxID=797122 RepID=A0A9K3CWY5_9EUKA|nr:hypothetical protein KIPB_006379 [Kipferlia bialata]|eukprot:g6379.t1
MSPVGSRVAQSPTQDFDNTRHTHLAMSQAYRTDSPTVASAPPGLAAKDFHLSRNDVAYSIVGRTRATPASPGLASRPQSAMAATRSRPVSPGLSKRTGWMPLMTARNQALKAASPKPVVASGYESASAVAGDSMLPGMYAQSQTPKETVRVQDIVYRRPQSAIPQDMRGLTSSQRAYQNSRLESGLATRRERDALKRETARIPSRYKAPKVQNPTSLVAQVISGQERKKTVDYRRPTTASRRVSGRPGSRTLSTPYTGKGRESLRSRVERETANERARERESTAYASGRYTAEREGDREREREKERESMRVAAASRQRERERDSLERAAEPAYPSEGERERERGIETMDDLLRERESLRMRERDFYLRQEREREREREKEHVLLSTAPVGERRHSKGVEGERERDLSVLHRSALESDTYLDNDRERERERATMLATEAPLSRSYREREMERERERPKMVYAAKRSTSAMSVLTQYSQGNRSHAARERETDRQKESGRGDATQWLQRCGMRVRNRDRDRERERERR